MGGVYWDTLLCRLSAPKVISRGSENGPNIASSQNILKEVPDNRLIVAPLGILFPWCSPRDSREFRLVVVRSS